MTTNELRQKFLEFYKSKGHTIIPSASLLPENDPTVLFTTAGMHPLVPYLLGEEHPGGKRVASVQKCIRTGDIDEVGDNRHLTFFEMLGNWSFGDSASSDGIGPAGYFKKEAIAWSFEFLTSRDWLALPAARLYVSVFAGDSDAPRDEESIKHWQAAFAGAGLLAEVGDYQQGINEGQRIFVYGKNKNWWGPAGETGPCGPDTEMFYDVLNLPNKKEHAAGWSGREPCQPNCDCGRYVEIWNDVFMEYNKKVKGQKSKVKNDEEVEYEFVPLKQKNVDTGMGLERTVSVINGAEIFNIDVFKALIEKIEKLSGQVYGIEPETTRSMRIIADHIKAAVFIIGDAHGLGPSNVGQGYIVRRLIRRAIRYAQKIGVKEIFTPQLVRLIVESYALVYPEIKNNLEFIVSEFDKEEEKFSKTLENGVEYLKKIFGRAIGGIDPENLPKGMIIENNVIRVDGREVFRIYETYGLPIEISQEIMTEWGLAFDKSTMKEAKDAFEKHQELSRTASAGVFKGGLADHSEEVVKLHTATHLLHQALRDVLRGEVMQKGSNITAERLRFDFVHTAKLTTTELQQVEKIVNEKIKADLPVHFELLSVTEAKSRGAIGVFEDKYSQLGNKVKVYFVGDYSAEICGGPHVEHTGQIGSFKILKEEAVAAGVRRIKAAVKV